MVGHRDIQMEWQNSPQEGDRHSHQFRCIPAGLGSMVTSGHSSHQLPRVAGGNSCSAVIHNAQMQNICATVNRQHCSCGLHKSLGGYSIQGFNELDKEPVDVVFREKHSYHSSTPPRNPECCRRCGIPVTDRQDILEAEPFHFLQDSEDLRPTGSGSLCNSPVFPVPTLLQLAARSICRSNRCISPSLDPHQGVCQPSLESSRQDTHPVVNSTSYHCAGGSSVEGTTMVPCSPTHANRLPETNNNRNEDNGTVWHISGKDTEANSFWRKLLTSCLAPGELKQKSSMTLFAKRHCWCSERSADPLSSIIAQVANFLVSLYRDGYQYSPINAYDCYFLSP